MSSIATSTEIQVFRSLRRFGFTDLEAFCSDATDIHVDKLGSGKGRRVTQVDSSQLSFRFVADVAKDAIRAIFDRS